MEEEPRSSGERKAGKTDEMGQDVSSLRNVHRYYHLTSLHHHKSYVIKM